MQKRAIDEHQKKFLNIYVQGGSFVQWFMVTGALLAARQI
jgi:hypothetical protein